MSKKEKVDLRFSRKLTQLTMEADEVAAWHWRLAARDREKGYEQWLKKVKKISHFVDVFKKKDSNVDL